MGYIQGYIATISVDTTVVSPITSSATLALTRNAIDKTKLGQDRVTRLSALGDANLDVQMHLDTEQMVALNDAYESTVPVAYVFRPGALGTHDAGQYAGDCIITDMSIAGDSEGEWDVSLNAECTGQYVYTQPA